MSNRAGKDSEVCEKRALYALLSDLANWLGIGVDVVIGGRDGWVWRNG